MDEHQRRPQPDEDTNTHIDTGGGSMVRGNVEIQNGDFVGRDKNIYIGSIPVPRWLLSLLAVTAIIVIIGVFYAANRTGVASEQTEAVATKIFEPTPTPTAIPTATPAVMDKSIFGVAIPPLQAVDQMGSVTQIDLAHELAGTMAHFLNEERENLRAILGQSVVVWGPDLAPQSVTDETAAEVAAFLNADILLYGTLRQSSAQEWIFQPAFYISEQAVQRSVDLGGEHPLGQPIRVLPDNAASLRNVNLALQERIETLSQVLTALSSMAIGDRSGYEQAAKDLARAVAEKQSPDADAGLGEELLYHFLGAAYLQWASLLDDDHADRAQLLVQAQAAYEHALAANPDYVRANNGLGSTLFQRSRPLVRQTPQDPCDWQWPLFDDARDQYETALQAPAIHKPPSGHVDLFSHFGLGRIGFYAGACRFGADLDAMLGQWQEAENHYQQVLTAFAAIDDPLPLLQNMAAYAHADLGQIELIRWDLLAYLGESDDETLTKELNNAIDDLSQAIGLDLASGTEAGEKHALAALPNYLTALCFSGQGSRAEDELDHILDEVQGTEEMRSAIVARVLPQWEECIHAEQ